MRRRFAALAVLVVLVSTAAIAAQPQVPQGGRGAGPGQPPGSQAPAGTGAISGTLVAVDTGRPVRRARISATNTERADAKSATTDDQGRFAFTNLPAGRYALTAGKPGYLDASYGQKRPGSGRAGTPIPLADGQRIENIRLQIPRGGVITGVVVDEQGDPSFGTTVRAMRYVMRTGERMLQSAGSATTDDRGMYRIPGLLPGEYLISAMPRDGGLNETAMADMKMQIASAQAAVAEEMRKVFEMQVAAASDSSAMADSGYAPVYYANTTLASQATTVTLDISEEKTGIDVPLQLVPLQRVQGTVIASDGALPQGVSVTLVDATGVVPGLPQRGARVSPDGRFTFSGVPPGQYTVVARSAQIALKMPLGGDVAMAVAKAGLDPGAPDRPNMWAMADVVTDGRSPVTVSLVLQQGMTVSGRVMLDGPAPNVDLTKSARVQVAPVGQGPIADLASSVRTVAPDAEGRFTLVGVPPGKYRISMAMSPPSWTLRSSVVAGQDTLDIPIEVKAGENVTGAALTLGNRLSELAGTLLGASGQPIADYTVIVFSAENRFWTPQSRRIQATRPGTDGRFSVRGLPAGDYRLVAVADIEPGQWFDPALLRQLFGASMALSLTDGERKTQDVRVK